MIEIAEEIAVPGPPERVWAVISSPADVVACIPGAELGAAHDDGSFDGVLAVKFGALRVRFAARVGLELEEEARAGRISARGRDGQGGTRFTGGATFQVAADGSGGARVRVDGEVNLTGKLASIVEAGAGAVVGRMTKEFSAALVERCAGPADAPGPEPAARPGLLARCRAWWARLWNKEVRSGTAQ